MHFDTFAAAAPVVVVAPEHFSVEWKYRARFKVAQTKLEQMIPLFFAIH